MSKPNYQTTTYNLQTAKWKILKTKQNKKQTNWMLIGLSSSIVMHSLKQWHSSYACTFGQRSFCSTKTNKQTLLLWRIKLLQFERLHCRFQRKRIDPISRNQPSCWANRSQERDKFLTILIIKGKNYFHSKNSTGIKSKQARLKDEIIQFWLYFVTASNQYV